MRIATGGEPAERDLARRGAEFGGEPVVTDEGAIRDRLPELESDAEAARERLTSFRRMVAAGMPPSSLRTAVVGLALASCASSPAPSPAFDAGATKDLGAPADAAASADTPAPLDAEVLLPATGVGAAGGALIAGPLRIVIGSGAMGKGQVFRVLRLPSDGVTPPAGMSFITPIYRVEPADYSFLIPVHVEMQLDAARSTIPGVTATGGVLAFGAPAGTSRWQPYASAPSGATLILGDTLRMGDFAVAVAPRIGCASPTACAAPACDGGTCAGSCGVTTQDGLRGLGCVVGGNPYSISLTCTCSSGVPGERPLVAAPFALPSIEPRLDPCFAAWLYANDCGWGCGGGTDGGSGG